jgi:hypothetical protein
MGKKNPAINHKNEWWFKRTRLRLRLYEHGKPKSLHKEEKKENLQMHIV